MFYDVVPGVFVKSDRKGNQIFISKYSMNLAKNIFIIP